VISLGVDVGGTSSKWAVVDNGRLVQTGCAQPLKKHLFLEAETHSFENLCREIRESMPRLDQVIIGITGVLRATEQQKIATKVICDVWGIASEKVLVMSDIELNYISQFQDSDGILISAGTGSIAAYRDNSGLITCIGGKGYLIGDEGSGYWIGAEGIRRSIRFFEEKCNDEALGIALKEFYKIDDWREIVEIVYSASGRSKIASAAKTVISAATDGSRIAIDIVEQAVGDLARLYEIANRSSISDELRVIGGVLEVNSPLNLMLARRLNVSLSNRVIKPEIYAAKHGAGHA